MNSSASLEFDSDMHEDYFDPLGFPLFPSNNPSPLPPTSSLSHLSNSSSSSSSLHRTLLIIGICVTTLTMAVFLLVFLVSFFTKLKNSFENKHHENLDLEHGQEQQQQQDDDDGHITIIDDDDDDDDDDDTTSHSSADNNVPVKSPTWLKQLNIVKYRGGGMGGSPSSVCNICFDNFKIDDPCRVMPGCGHTFHHSCVDVWFKKSPTCPTCRNSIIDALALAPIK